MSPAAGAAAAPVKRSTVRALPAPVAFDADDQALLNQTIGYYHERLQATPEAAAYLVSRGLVHPDLVSMFRLGVADRSLGLRLPEKNRKDGAVVRARLQKVGLLRESGHEHFNGSLVVPIFDEAGNVIELRCTYDEATRHGMKPEGRPKPKGIIHWVSARHAITAPVRLYDRLFLNEDPEDGDGDFISNLNPNSLEVLTDARLEPSLNDAPAGAHYQFERVGYFYVDPKDSAAGAPVFNRTVGLKDAWAKQVAKS